MANRFWVGGSANWDATAGTKWSLTSGGTGNQAVPTGSDDVFFDANSGANTVTVATGGGATCNNITFAGFTGTFAGSQSFSCVGNVSLAATTTYTYTGTIQLSSSSGTITNNGATFSGSMNVSSGAYTIQDAVSISGVTASLGCSGGTLATNNQTISVPALSSSGSGVRTVNLGSSNITIITNGTTTALNFATTTNLTFNAGTSTITINDTSANAKTFAGGGLAYNNVVLSGDNITVSGANTFASLAINTAGLTNGVKLTASVTQSVSAFTTNGSAGNLAKLQSTSSGTAATLSRSGGTISVDYMSIKDSTATGGTAWYAGANSTNVSGNTGWIFTAAPANSSGLLGLM